MSREQMLLSWDEHHKNICNDLSQLQQRGEFVDMTLAADGYYVKVHQLVISMASPYIRALILTANCPHPVIFLNNMSYTALCSILEYIYTGQVLVDRDKLGDVIAAGKALHIRGFRGMVEQEIPQAEDPITTTNINPPTQESTTEHSEQLIEHKENERTIQEQVGNSTAQPICEVYLNENDSNVVPTDGLLPDPVETIDSNDYKSYELPPELKTKAFVKQLVTAVGLFRFGYPVHGLSALTPEYLKGLCACDVGESLLREITALIYLMLAVEPLLYSISNQGGIQAIHLRYLYRLKYICKKDGVRMWRCIDYSNNLKCPATISTNENNQVTCRSYNHNHLNHDRKIQIKIRSGRIYAGFSEAAYYSEKKHMERQYQSID